MMYSEFLKLANLTENDIGWYYYTSDIEPAYREMPDDIVKDKQAFVKWWKANTALCKWISNKVQELESMEQDFKEKVEEAAKAKKEVEERQATIETIVNANTELSNAVYRLQLRAAFAPEKLTDEMRLKMWDSYEDNKLAAIQDGIIKG